MEGLRIILASASPRRRELLGSILEDFEVIPSQIVEIIPSGISPLDVAMNNAMEKALNISVGHPEAIIIGADTLVVLDDIIMGKPADIQDAIRMLKTLSGRTHQVITGVAIVNTASKVQIKNFDISDVTFRDLEMTAIETYVKENKPLDKAGAYNIQEVKDTFIECLEGNYDNVMGLPLDLVADMFDEIMEKILIEGKSSVF